MPKLIIRGPSGERVVELREGPNIIGRSPKAAVPIRDSAASREHCEVQLSGETCVVLDKGSMNGTIVNGKRILEQTLNPGDCITIGTTSIYYQEAPAAEAPEKEEAHVAAKPAEDRPTSRKVGPEEPSTVAAKPDTKSRRPSTVRRAVSPGVPDFAVWTRDRSGLGRKLALVVILALAVAAVFIVKGMFPSGPVTREDADNLLTGNPSFETAAQGAPVGWKLVEGGKSVLGVDVTGARHGKSCLVLEKSGVPSEMVVECAAAEKVDLGSISAVDAGFWARAEGFQGWAMLKVAWLAQGGAGAPILEETSPPVKVGTDWAQITHRFVPPRGAHSMRVGLEVAGRAGRVLFDDVRLKEAPGAGPRSGHRLGGFTFLVSKETGLFSVFDDRGRRVVREVAFGLFSERDGAIPQNVATAKDFGVEEDRIRLSGSIPNPVDFTEVGFDQAVVRGGDGVTAVYSFPAGALRTVDRILVWVGLPSGAEVEGVPENAADGTVEVRFRAAGRDLAIEYPHLLTVRQRKVNGGTVLEHEFRPEEGDITTIGFKLREGAGARGRENPPDAAAAAVRGDRPGEALSILRPYAEEVRDPRKRDAAEKSIRDLEKLEWDEWDRVRASAFRAEVSERREVVEEAQEELSTYLRRWGASGHSSEAAAIRDSLKILLEESVRREREARAKILLEQAKQYTAIGWEEVGKEILSVLMTRYGDTSAAARATGPEEEEAPEEEAPEEKPEGE